MISGITVALLANKEAENLKMLLPEIIDNLKIINVPFSIEVIDTAEPSDNTEEICAEYGVQYIRQEMPGFGGALRTAIKYADRQLFLILDSDGSHKPCYIPMMFDKFVTDKCDIVIGSRYVEGGKTLDNVTSVIMSRILNTTYRFCLGISAHDISTDYRMYDTYQLKKVKLENVYFDILQEVLLKMKLNNPNLKIGEVPITFEKRIHGKSKRKLIPFIFSYIKTLCKLTLMRFTVIK